MTATRPDLQPHGRLAAPARDGTAALVDEESPSSAGPAWSPNEPEARRAALDGLRAVAVTAVLIYHFGGGDGSILPGGFLGVDLFFVLSGYLITGLLVREHRRYGSVRLTSFWARRIRRLMPALLVVLVAVSAWTWWAAPPESWAARRTDILWTLGNLANWHFIAAGEDYFAAYAGASPLRHTWSLSIEEQFYAVWPLVVLGALWLANRVSLRRRASPAPRRHQGARPLAVLTGVLIAVSAIAMASSFETESISRAYYGTDGRVQQLLVGALLAVVLLARAPSAGGPSAPVERAGMPAGWAGVAAFAGAVGVAVAFLLVHDDSPVYYQGGALAFAVAVAAVVASVDTSPRSVLARALSWRPAVLLGRISYGVYLWHWPVLLVIPTDADRGSTSWWAVQAARVAVTLGCSTASFFLLEQPIMSGRVPWLGRSRARTYVAAAAGVSMACAVAIAATRIPEPLGTQLRDRAEASCPGATPDRLLVCVQQQGRPSRNVTLLLGDSTAASLVPGLVERARVDGTTLVQAAWQRCTATGLMVVPNGRTSPDEAARVCAAQARIAIAGAIASYRPDRVVVSEYWTHHQPILSDGRVLPPGSSQHADAIRDAYVGIADQVAAVGGRIVFVELPPPGRSIGGLVAAGRPAGEVTSSYGSQFVAGYNAGLSAVAAARPATATTVSIADLLCPELRCEPLQDGRLVRTDGVHLTNDYSRRLAPVLLARIDGALADMSDARP